jgi:hypothetical protein
MHLFVQSSLAVTILHHFSAKKLLQIVSSNLVVGRWQTGHTSRVFAAFQHSKRCVSALLPWQTNITFIIRFFLSDLLSIAVFCALYRGLFFLLPIWQNGTKTTKRGRF